MWQERWKLYSQSLGGNRACRLTLILWTVEKKPEADVAKGVHFGGDNDDKVVVNTEQQKIHNTEYLDLGTEDIKQFKVQGHFGKFSF